MPKFEFANLSRRSFAGIALGVTAASVFGEHAVAQRATGTEVSPNDHAALDASERIDAGDLSVSYAALGPADGPAVLLLHGWPYGINSFAQVAPLLAEQGHRVFVPFLRGYGGTRFLSAKTKRNGQPSALAVELMDALKIEKATIAGFDWGARTGDIVAILWPEHCKALVSVSGYLVGSQSAGKTPLPPSAELQWWYQYYFATDRGRDGYGKYTNDFNKLIWKLASPNWKFDDATFERSAAAFSNPDHVEIVVHNYRWRLGLAQGESGSTSSKPSWRTHLKSSSRRLPWKATPTARLIQIPKPMPGSSRADTNIVWSRAGSATTYHRRLPKPSPRLS